LRKVLTRLVLGLILALVPTVAAAQAHAAARPMTSGSCGGVITTEYFYFPDVSTTTPVASLKLLSGDCAYLFMWSWFTAGHSGWTVGLTTCPGGDSGAYPVYPVTNGGGAVAHGCASPYVWTNTSRPEFYGPAAFFGCDYASLQLIYNSDNIDLRTSAHCST
jgi:hypothetical protein